MAVVGAARGDISLSVLLRISWSTSPFREEERDFKSPSLSIGGKNGMCEGTFNSTSVQIRQKKILLFGASVKGCCRRQQHARLQCTTVHNKGSGNIKQRQQARCCSLGRGGGGRGRHRSFSRLCYLSRRQFRNSGAVPQNRLCEIGLNPESEMSMLGSLDAQI